MKAHDKIIAFGAVADLQYCDADPQANRFFRNAPIKLSSAMEAFNKNGLDFVMSLGDTIDGEWNSYDGILPQFNACGSKVYHVLGNHDYEVEDQYKSRIHTRIGTAKYYDFSLKNWRFIVLDGNEISTYANIKESENYQLAERYLGESKVNSNFWNGGIGQEQLVWLGQRLDHATEQTENVLIFCHFPIYPSHRHNLLNDTEVLSILKDYECTKAWICGHNHNGNYGRIGDIHFISLKGIVETENETAFSIFSLFDDRIEIQGFGSEISARLSIY